MVEDQSAMQNQVAEVAAGCPTSQVWVLGSGECDQLGLEFDEDDVMEIKRARKIELFNNDEGDAIPASIGSKIAISRMECGGMHTVVLTPMGTAYSWGCNDDGALGRTDGNDSLPGLVPLTQRINGLSLGGSHSIFYNTELSTAFFCGLYRNALEGKVNSPVQEPTLFGAESFRKGKRRLTKIVSGMDHSVALTTDGKVWAWGDPESGKIGRILKSRTQNTQSRKIEQVGAKKAVDVWCGGHASFYRNDKGVLFAWGLNNHGQLGVGHKENVCAPSRVLWLHGEAEEAIEVAGGEHHTVALTKSGRVYCWGRNDEGECGVGDLFGKYRREQALLEHQKLEEAERQAREEAEKAAALAVRAAEGGEQPTDEVQKDNAEAQPEAKAVSKSRKSSKKSRMAEEPDLINIFYFSVPNPVPSLEGKGVTKVSANGHYNYALCAQSNEVYAWGMGSNFVLGTRDEENEFEPRLVNSKQFLENRVDQIGNGVQHIVVLTTASKELDSRLPPLDKEILSSIVQPLAKPSEAEPAADEEMKEPAAQILSQQQPEQLKVTSQKHSQTSIASRKRKVAELAVGQQALEEAINGAAVEGGDEKREKGE